MSTDQTIPAKKESKFINVKESLPVVKSHSAVASSSPVILLQLESGKTVLGQYQRWDRDMNAYHITAKKGDGFFYDMAGTQLKNVTGWAKVG